MKNFFKDKKYVIIAIVVVLNLVIHLIADFHAGFHGDELLHIDAGRHLAFGYMDFSPVIAYLAFIQNLFHSDSMLINHLFVHIATGLIFVFCGLATIKLGGKWLAVLIVMLSVFFSPGFGATHSLFLPDLFEQLAWVICVYLLILYSEKPLKKYILLFGIFAAVGLLTKYSVAFLLSGVVISYLIFERRLLKEKALSIAFILFLILISPNVLWQIENGLPVLHHFSKLYETQLDSRSRFDELKTLFLYLNPATAVFWITGFFIAPFNQRFKKYQVVVFTLLSAFILLFIAKGKTYYYFPVILCVLPFGAIYFEQLFAQKERIVVSYLAILSLIGIILLPKGVPVLPLDTYIKAYHVKPNGDHKYPIPFENYYSKRIWKQILATVDTTYHTLPKSKQKKCLIWGRHYSQAGGINLLGRKYGLPQAFSFHSSYYNWVPDFTKDETIIVIADPAWDREHWLRYFNSIKEVRLINNPYTVDKKWYSQGIYLCRDLKYNSAKLKKMFKNEIY